MNIGKEQTLSLHTVSHLRLRGKINGLPSPYSLSAPKVLEFIYMWKVAVTCQPSCLLSGVTLLAG